MALALKFPEHVCKSECNCKVCKDYINKKDQLRQVEVNQQSKDLVSLGQTSSSKIVRMGKRKFDLPKPSLTRPNLKEAYQKSL